MMMVVASMTRTIYAKLYIPLFHQRLINKVNGMGLF